MVKGNERLMMMVIGVDDDNSGDDGVDGDGGGVLMGKR